MRRGLEEERAANLAAGGVAVGVQHAIAAVRAFAGEGDLGAGAIELRAPLDEFFDARRTFFHQNARRFFVDQPVAGLQRVFQMQPNLIVVAERGRDTALRILRIRLGDFALGQTEHPARGRQFDRSAQAGNARAHHDEIGF